MATTTKIRFLLPADEARWRVLFREYREFYELPESEEVVSRAWGWFMDPRHECKALVAEVDGEILGFAHHRRFSSPYTGTTGLFLDDLFTDPAARGRGVGRALIGRLTEMAAAEGHALVQWVTAEDNHQAQALYDTLAKRTNWVTYEALPAAT
ncbi:GNAT family N-acetyltransferase [Rhodococcus hoagii]|uniref:GNAT family N-acetyltransferase n=1 Tax=Rhodococcus hoagii TaxID=43767 RepID=UPI000A0F784A|nr:GNAT family N-acetyltransferase [Prescottella equi]MBM4482892.1 GNAT family N-acetyltransferase [Prescottella equi]NKR43987.1 GNAT family N-acetyltransferase [Prescottella equi]NKR61970.1 GNAT family N-acetyltransferase [Prescottella equi]NKR70907.1 GNAT family N-acetyltransferase [Prescottella equi]NKR75334.1 GNAT family N-acetyltransferase [Prescottella equi]